MELTKEQVVKKIEEAEKVKEQLIGNLNVINGRIMAFKEILEDPKKEQEPQKLEEKKDGK